MPTVSSMRAAGAAKSMRLAHAQLAKAHGTLIALDVLGVGDRETQAVCGTLAAIIDRIGEQIAIHVRSIEK